MRSREEEKDGVYPPGSSTSLGEFLTRGSQLGTPSRITSFQQVGLFYYLFSSSDLLQRAVF